MENLQLKKFHFSVSLYMLEDVGLISVYLFLQVVNPFTKYPFSDYSVDR